MISVIESQKMARKKSTRQEKNFKILLHTKQNVNFMNHCFVLQITDICDYTLRIMHVKYKSHINIQIPKCLKKKCILCILSFLICLDII